MCHVNQVYLDGPVVIYKSTDPEFDTVRLAQYIHSDWSQSSTKMSQWQEGPWGAHDRSAEALQNAINSTSAAKSAKEGFGEKA